MKFLQLNKANILPLIFMLTFGLIFGLAFGPTYGLIFGLAFGPTYGLIFGLAFGLLIGLIFGLLGWTLGHPRLRRTVILHIVAWGIAVVWIIPFMGIAMTAIRPTSEVIRGWWNLDPFTLGLDNFARVLFNPLFPMITGLGSSAIIAITATLLPLGVGALAAYGFARFRFPLRDYMFLAIVLVMAVPTMMVIIPTFQIMANLKLLNTYLALVLIHTAWGLPWIILFMRNFFRTLPVEIEEAARVDGASDFKVFYRVALPMALPALASVFVLQFMWVWSDFFFALILVQGNPSIWPATFQLPFTSFAGQFHNDWGLLSAGSLLVMLVPIGVYVLLQKYYIRGMIGWTVKG